MRTVRVEVGTRCRAWAGPVVLVVLAGVFLWPVLLGTRVLVPADILMMHPPWRQAGSAEPQNSLLADQVEEFYPDRLLVRDAIRSGRLPLWNPFAAGGRPLLGNGQSAALFPLNALSYVLPVAVSFGWIAWMKLSLAGLGTYALLRSLERSAVASTAGASAFMLCGYLVLWLNHPQTNVAIWLPMLLLATRALGRTPGPWQVLGVAGIIALQFFGGRPDISLHVLAAATAYLIVLVVPRSPEPRVVRRGRVLMAFAAALGLGAAVAAVQLVPLAEYLGESSVVEQRAAQTGQGIFRAPRLLEVPLLVFPYLYGTPVQPRNDFGTVLGVRNFSEACGGYVGVAVQILAVLAVVFHWRDRTVRFLAGLGVVCWLVALDVPPIAQAVTLAIGGGLVRSNRLLLLVAFALACLAAFGLDAAAERMSATARRRLSTALIVAALVVSVTVLAAVMTVDRRWDELLDHGRARLFALYQAAPSAERQASLAEWTTRLPWIAAGIRRAVLSPTITAVFLVLTALWLGGVLGRTRTATLARAAVIPLIVADLWLFGYWYNPKVERERVFPTTASLEFMKREAGASRVLGLDKVLLENTAAVYGISDMRGEDGINVRRYADLLVSTWSRPMRNLFDTSRYPDPESRLVDLLAVKYVAVDGKLDGPKFRHVYDGEMSIYENTQALRRAYVVFQWVSAPSRERAWALVRASDFDPRTTVVLEGWSGPQSGGDATGTASVDVARIAAESVDLRVRLSAPGFLVLSDVFFPGWHAAVDGAATPIYRANYAFRGLALPAGEHVVQFWFRPRSLTVGGWISAAGVAAMAGIGLSALRGRRS